MVLAVLLSILPDSFQFQYPLWFIPLCLLLGALYAFVLYFKDKTFADTNSSKKALRWILGITRFTVISLIAFFLLEPFVKTQFTEIEKPIVIVAHDNSESINTHFKNADSTAYVEAYNGLITNLEEKYEVNTYTFADKVSNGNNLSFTEKVTDVSDLFSELYEKYANQNVGAVVIATDGIYNRGNNPAYSNLKLNVPVYSIALGDTNPRKDLKIFQVYHNKIAYLDDKFSIKIDVSALNCLGEKTNLTVKKAGGSTVFNKTITIDKKVFEADFEVIIDATTAGIQQYSVSTTPVSKELTTTNNYKTFYIDVLDSRQKILLLAHAPHPDLTAIKQSIETNKNYETSIQFASNFKGSIAEYDMVLLHQLPSNKHEVASVVQEIKSKRMPVWYVVGGQTDINKFNSIQNTLKITGSNNSINKVTPIAKSGFQLFTLDDKLINSVKAFPPLNAPYGEISATPTAKVLLNQKIGSVGTDYPLLAYNDDINGKVAVLAGEGIWRWRLFDFMTNQSHDLINELVNKSVQYTSVKSDKRQFRATSQKNLYFENEPIVIDAELYNDSYELINEPDAFLKIYSEEQKEFPFTFSKTSNAYNVNAGFFVEGNYTFTASTTYNGKNYSSKGKFSVSPIQIESQQLQANHKLLYLLAEKYGGEVTYPNNMTELANIILQTDKIKPIAYESYQTKAIINYRWIFFVLIALLALEWFIRKFKGGY